jgi:twitching motility two-component system response regulator PilG
MPRLDGYKLCKFVKKHERTRSIPVIMLSGKDGVFDKLRGKMSGCNDFLSKPFDAAVLLQKIQQHIARNATNQR